MSSSRECSKAVAGEIRKLLYLPGSFHHLLGRRAEVTPWPTAEMLIMVCGVCKLEAHSPRRYVEGSRLWPQGPGLITAIRALHFTTHHRWTGRSQTGRQRGRYPPTPEPSIIHHPSSTVKSNARLQLSIVPQTPAGIHSPLSATLLLLGWLPRRPMSFGSYGGVGSRRRIERLGHAERQWPRSDVSLPRSTDRLLL